jgi:hypothetical protein
MSESMVDWFFEYEYDDNLREILTIDIASRDSGIARRGFNLFEVVIDFDSRLVTVESVLDPDAETTVSLSEFMVRLIGPAER